MSNARHRLYRAVENYLKEPNAVFRLTQLQAEFKAYDEEQVAMTGLFTAVALIALFAVLPAAIGFMMLGVWTDFRWFWTGMIMAPAALVMFAIGAIGAYERHTRRTE